MSRKRLAAALLLIAAIAVHLPAQAQPVVTVSAASGDADEAGPVSKTLTFTRSGDTSGLLSVEVRGTGSATWTQDATSPDISFLGSNRFRVQIAGGASSKSVIITPTADNLVEGTEDFTFTIQPPVSANAYTIGAQESVSFDILDDPVEVTISTQGADEATEAGQGEAVLTVTRTDQGNTSALLFVDLRGLGTATWTQDATSPDFSFLGSNRFRVTIPANALSKQVFLTPRTDNRVEGTEDFEFTIQAPTIPTSQYVIGTASTASFTIADDAAVVTLSIEDDAIGERGDKDTLMEVRRTAQGDVTALLQIEVRGTGTASWSQDLTSSDLSFLGSDRFRVTIPANQLSRSILIETDFDGIDEGNETITFSVQPSPISGSEYLTGDPGSDSLLVIDFPDLIFKNGIEGDQPAQD